MIQFPAGERVLSLLKVSSCGVHLAQGWQNFLRLHAQTVYKSAEILLQAHGNFEEQNKVSENSEIIIISYCIIIINVYYNYTINAQ